MGRLPEETALPIPQVIRLYEKILEKLELQVKGVPGTNRSSRKTSGFFLRMAYLAYMLHNTIKIIVVLDFFVKYSMQKPGMVL